MHVRDPPLLWRGGTPSCRDCGLARGCHVHDPCVSRVVRVPCRAERRRSRKRAEPGAHGHCG
eukprot:6752562-Prymnesium_polylepis.2